MTTDNSFNENQKPRRPSPFGWFTVIFVPPFLLMATALPISAIENPNPLEAAAPNIAFGISIFYLVVQLGMILFRGKPMYTD